MDTIKTQSVKGGFMKKLLTVVILGMFMACSDTPNANFEKNGSSDVIITHTDVIGTWEARNMTTYIFHQDGTGEVILIRSPSNVSHYISWKIVGDLICYTYLDGAYSEGCILIRKVNGNLWISSGAVYEKTN